MFSRALDLGRVTLAYVVTAVLQHSDPPVFDCCRHGSCIMCR